MLCLSLVDSFKGYYTKEFSSIEQNIFEETFSSIINKQFSLASKLFEGQTRAFLEKKSLRNSKEKYLSAYEKKHTRKEYESYFQTHIY